MERGDTHTIDIKKRVASSIKVAMSKDLFMSPKRCIFKTPIILRRHNEKAYMPDAFSIGPFHHGHKKLKATEIIKAKYLQDRLKHFEQDDDTVLANLIKSVSDLEEEAREYYAEEIKYNQEEFLKILVIDGCFLIELFRRTDGEKENGTDPLVSSSENGTDPLVSSSMVEVLGHDLILLENQVPWKVLKRLFNVCFEFDCNKSLIELACAFFSYISPFNWMDGISSQDLEKIEHDIKHIPDLFKKLLLLVPSVKETRQSESQSSGCHSQRLPSDPPPPTECRNGIWQSSEWQLVPSATRLTDAGIKLTQKSEFKNMLHITFTNGVLAIPRIKIHEITETFFRNLISFEQCCPNSDDEITSYCKFLDNLINTAEDVEILSENNILDNWLNPEDAAKFFNQLYHDTFVHNYVYRQLCHDVNIYYAKEWTKWRAVLMRKYFNNPWAGLSTLAAVTLLFLTFVQTLVAIIKG